jgi:hypothetical protein
VFFFDFEKNIIRIVCKNAVKRTDFGILVST